MQDLEITISTSDIYVFKGALDQDSNDVFSFSIAREIINKTRQMQ